MFKLGSFPELNNGISQQFLLLYFALELLFWREKQIRNLLIRYHWTAANLTFGFIRKVP